MDMIAARLAEKLVALEVIDQKDMAIYRYGLEVLLLSLLELTSILLLAFIVGNFIETLVYFMVFIPLRVFAGGYHASTRLRCYLLSLIVYGIFTILLYMSPLPLQSMLSTGIAFLSSVIICLITPVDLNARACSETERAVILKNIRIILIFDLVAFVVCWWLRMNMMIFIISLGLLTEGLFAWMQKRTAICS